MARKRDGHPRGNAQDLEEMERIAAEQGAIVAMRVVENGDMFEPVPMRARRDEKGLVVLVAGERRWLIRPGDWERLIAGLDDHDD